MTSIRLFAGSTVAVLIAASMGACPLPPKSAGENDASSSSSSTGAESVDPPPQASADSSTGPAPVPSTTTGVPADSTETGAEYTCREAVECVVECAARLSTTTAEPDLTCFLECEQNLTADEALELFMLTECATQECIDMGVCEVLEATSTSETTGGSGSSGNTDGTGTGTGTDTGTSSSTGEPNDRCLDCLLLLLQDSQPGAACEEFAYMCH